MPFANPNGMSTPPSVISFPSGIKRIIVLGARPLVIDLVQFAQEHGIPVDVFAGPRQRSVAMGNGTLLHQALERVGVSMRFASALTELDGGPYDTADDATLVWSFASPYPVDERLFELCGGRIVNLHCALLPEWRGGGGLSWMILSGERDGGGTVHLLPPSDWSARPMHTDDGAVLRRFPVRYPHHLRFPADYEAYFDEAARPHLIALLRDLHHGKVIETTPQDESRSRFLPRLSTAKQAFIDWDQDGAAIERFILAFSHPYPGATTFVASEREVRIFDARFIADSALQHPFIHGVIFRVSDDRLFVVCKGGYLCIRLADVTTDHAFRSGDRLTTPRTRIDAGRAFQPAYDASGPI